MSYKNLCINGKKIMEQHCPDLCQLFSNLSDGSIPTFKAKEALEVLLGDRLWTNQNAFWKFRQHNYENVDVAFKLYQIRPPSPSPMSGDDFPEDHQISVFGASVTLADVCRTKTCKAYHVRNYQQESIDHLFLPIRDTHDERLCQLQSCIRATRSPGPCQQCLRMKETEIQLFSGPLIIPMHGYVISNDKTITKSVPEQLQLGDITYTLSACSYGEGAHFVSIARDFSSNRLLFCDGMANNAQFVEYKASTGKFPTRISRKELQQAFFVRSEYTIKHQN